MQQATAFYNFSNACERFLFALRTNMPLAELEVQVVAYYCKEILARSSCACKTLASQGLQDKPRADLGEGLHERGRATRQSP